MSTVTTSGEIVRPQASGSFAYRAVRSDGSVEQGLLHAQDRAAASGVLAGRGLFPLELRAIDASSPRALGGRRRIPAGELALGLRTLGTLLEAGLPVGRALWTFADVAPASWQPALPMLQQAVREGRSLAAALAASPLAFPPVTLGIVQAGEAGGSMARAVVSAAELAERDAAFRAALRAALAYPVLLGVVGSGAVALLILVVIPRFAAVLTELGETLPPATRAVLTAADIAQRLAMPSLLITAGGWLAWLRWTAAPAGRARWHALLLGLPVVGAVRHAAASARLGAAAAELLESGMPLSTALLHAADATGDAALRERVLAARERVVQGSRVGAAFAAERALTPVAVKLIQTGEESGRLSAMFAQAARLEALRAETFLRTVVRLLEPALLLIFGGIVALVAAALLQAVYTVRPGA